MNTKIILDSLKDFSAEASGTISTFDTIKSTTTISRQYSDVATKCSQCNQWFYRSNVSCNVHHFGMCCHIHDLPVTENAEKPEPIDYKFREDELLRELQEYVNTTYNDHYSKGKIQATEFIVDQGHGVGFCGGNVQKYISRYGKKAGYNRKDLLKALHYALILLHVHDLEHSEEK